MAEVFDSDSCLGFKRRISETPEIEATQPILEEQQHLNSLSPQQHPSEIISSAKEEERETENGLSKKAKLSSSDESQNQETEEKGEELTNCEVGFCGNQEIDEKGKVLKSCEVGFCGNQEIGEAKKSSSSRLTAEEGEKQFVVEDWNKGLVPSCVNFDENVSESCLKDKQDECLVESIAESIEGGMTHVSKFTDFQSERGIMEGEIENSSRGFDGNLGTVKISDSDGKGSFCEGMHKLADIDGEIFSVSCLKKKEEEYLVEPAVESVANAITQLSEFEDSSWILDANLGSVRIPDFNGKGSVCEKVEGVKGNGHTTECALKIEVIDETAVIETASAFGTGSSIGKEKGFLGCSKESERNVHKNVMKQETDGKKEKGQRRKGKGAKKLPGTNGKENVLIHTAEVGLGKKSDEAKRAYSREEMEALRYVNLEAQQKKWIEVYCGIDPTVAREYDGLIDRNNQKHIRLNFDPRQQFGKKEKKISGVLGEDCSQIMDNEIENMNPLGLTCGLSVSCGDDYTSVEGECSEEDDSDEEYSSIQRPAFLVTGEPNFDAGPPQDGWEYLRRVRWEAAQVPKVKVAKFERSKLNKEQTPYMPKIPDIEKCPEHLLPLKQWEDAFIADFSDLRMALSRLEGSSDEISVNLPFSSSIIPREECPNQLPETIIIEKFDKLTMDGDESDMALDSSLPEKTGDPRSDLSVNEKTDVSPSLENADADAKPFTSGSSSDSPTLSAVLRMDSVARLSMLRKRICSVENMSTLSRNDCAWLFALCAAIDTPLDADTCAALRCLLRKCASLRAGKSELDDEVVMLNILAMITGKYFGQSEF